MTWTEAVGVWETMAAHWRDDMLGEAQRVAVRNHAALAAAATEERIEALGTRNAVPSALEFLMQEADEEDPWN